MKKKISFLFVAAAAAALLTACASNDTGASRPVNTTVNNLEDSAQFVLFDKGAQESVTCDAIQQQRLPDGRLLAGIRLYQPKPRTALAWVDPTTGKLTECLALPSGGDTSYPGLVLHDGTLWVSYYSSHEGKTAIYLARAKVRDGE